MADLIWNLLPVFKSWISVRSIPFSRRLFFISNYGTSSLLHALGLSSQTDHRNQMCNFLQALSVFLKNLSNPATTFCCYSLMFVACVQTCWRKMKCFSYGSRNALLFLLNIHWGLQRLFFPSAFSPLPPPPLDLFIFHAVWLSWRQFRKTYCGKHYDLFQDMEVINSYVQQIANSFATSLVLLQILFEKSLSIDSNVSPLRNTVTNCTLGSVTVSNC